MDEAVVLFAQAYSVFQRLAAVLPTRYDVVIVVDTFLTEQAMPVLCGIDCFLYAALTE